jgi:CBS domain containing-hemolysin-like protein
LDDSLLSRTILFAVLLLFSGLFSACEAAFFSLSPLQLSEMKERHGRSGHLVQALLEKPRELLITIYIGNELVNIATSVVATSLAIKIFGSTGIGIAIGVATFFLLLFGEIIPKSLSLRYAETYALAASYPLRLFSKIVQPPQRLLTSLAEQFISLLGIGISARDKSSITDEEFRVMVQMGEGEGVIDSEERRMIHNVFEFGETTVADIMTPKIDMFTVSIKDSLDDILPRIVENFYSRVPVYDPSDETIAGILLTKDLNRMKLLPRENVHIKNILHPVFTVPKSKKIKVLLQEFRRKKQHMAIALDEYGSVCGLVTLEDVLEELVGEIDSEMRLDESPLVQIDENNYKVSAAFALHEFNEHFSSQLPENEHDTLGGLVFALLGRVPRSGEAVTFDKFKFRVEKMKGPRILNLHLSLVNGGPSPQAADEARKNTAL